MDLFVRLMVFVIIAVAAAWGENAYLQSNSQETARLSVASVNGGARELAELQQHEAGKNRSLLLTGIGVLAAGILLLGTYRPKPYVRYAPALLLCGLMLAGCMKAYDKPEYQDVDTKRGVMITNVGIYGGFTYENPEIQKSMDEAAMAANLKEIESQKLLAQKTANDRIALEATGRAEAAKLEAQGKADAILAEKTAEAKGIGLVNEALNDARQNPLLIQMKQLEIEQTRAVKWDGRYPTWYFGGAGNGAAVPNLMVNVPAPTDSR